MSNSKETDHNHQQTGVVVSSRVASGRRLSRKFVLVGGILLLALVVLGVAGILLKNTSKSNEPYVLTFSGSGKEFGITQTQYDTLVKQAGEQKVQVDQAKEIIIKAHQYKIVASALKLEPIDEQIKRAAQAGAGYSGDGAPNEWQQLYGYSAGVEANLKLAKAGGYVADVFVYPFDKIYYDNSLVYNTKLDLTAVAAAQKSASDEAAADRQKLNTGATNADTLITKLRQESKWSWAGGSNSSKQYRMNTKGVVFVDSDFVTNMVPDYAMSAIGGLNNKPGISDVREVRAVPYGAKEQKTIGYFFVSLDSVLSAQQDIDRKLDQALKSVKVVDHVK